MKTEIENECIVNGITYVAVQIDDCRECDLRDECLQDVVVTPCISDYRQDSRDIVWKIKK